MQFSLRIKKLLIILIAGAVLGLMFMVGLNTVQALRGIQALWHEHTSEATLHLAEINSVRQHFGYGGVSHHFHRYLLHPDATQQLATEQALIRLNESLARAEQLNLSPLERMALASIAEIAEQYRHAYLRQRARMAQQGDGKHFVPTSPGIDDDAALNALRLLDELALRRVERAQGEAHQRLDGTIKAIFGGALLLPMVLLLALMLLRFVSRISRANEALSHLGWELDSLLENAPEAMLTLGTNGRVLRVNARAEGLFGYSREELLNMPLDRLLPEWPSKLEGGLALLKDWQNTTRTVRTRSGETLRVELALGEFGEGGHRKLIITLRDISGRLHSQQRIEQLNRSLIRKNHELGALNQELEAFSYSVSHDLRSPLRAIDGFSQLLSKRYAAELDDTGQDYLQRIVRATARMGQIIDDLLQLSRTTRARMKPIYMDLSQLAKEVLLHLADTDRKREVDWEIQPGLNVIADTGLMRVVLENLLGNAWKYSATRELAEIRFGAEARKGEMVFFVCDNGVGFDMQYANKLFAVFQRLHNADEFEGSGIGLSTVQRIIHRHGGRIWAEAAVDHGACFYFTLGISDTHHEALEDQQ